MPAPSMSRTIRGTILQTPAPGALEVLDDHLVTVADDGVITAVEPARGAATEADHRLATGEVLLPGLVDTHIHAPQWPQRGTGLDLPLEEWLFEHTFPLEARYADTAMARRVWDDMVPTLLAHGTTTAVYYGSVHEAATLELARACVAHGQRAFVGRVAMDHPDGTPEWYRDADAAAGVAASARSIEQIDALPGAAGLVRPAVTPRFVPACTDALLDGLGELAAATGQLVQTHCSESDWEHGYVLDRHGTTDTRSLDQRGLLRDHTVLAHATHVTDDDRATIHGRGAGIAHCPLSNTYFSGRVFPTRRALDAGLRVGLGSDIAGGPETSLLRQCAHAVASSRHLDAEVAGSRIDIAAAFWLATVGGAELLGIPAGLLAAGRVFDAFAVDTAGLGIWPEIDGEARAFEKIVRLAAATDVTTVWVGGRRVVG